MHHHYTAGRMNRYAIVRILEEKSDILWGEFLKRFVTHIKANHKMSTVKCSELPPLNAFTRFIGIKKPLAEINIETIDEWRLTFSHLKQNTIRHRLLIVKCAINFAIEAGLLMENPLALVRIPKAEHSGRALTDTELKLFLPLLPIQIRRAGEVSLHTGMRRGEILSLEWPQVSDTLITIPDNKSKSGDGRKIPLHVKALAAMGVRRFGKVFDLSADQINHHVTRAWKKLGVGRIRFHDFRHTAITRALEAGMDVWTAMEIFGWKNENSAKPYKHITDALRAPMLEVRYRY